MESCHVCITKTIFRFYFSLRIFVTTIMAPVSWVDIFVLKANHGTIKYLFLEGASGGLFVPLPLHTSRE